MKNIVYSIFGTIFVQKQGNNYALFVKKGNTFYAPFVQPKSGFRAVAKGAVAPAIKKVAKTYTNLLTATTAARKVYSGN